MVQVPEAVIDEVCEELAQKITKMMEVKQAAARIHARMQHIHVKRKDEPMKLSPTDEAAKVLAEYHAAKRANDPIAEIHKANRDPVLSSNHYAELMKRYAAANAAEIAKSRGNPPAYLDPEWLKPGMEIDWSNPVDATRAYRAEKLAKSKVPHVEHAQPDGDDDEKTDWNDDKSATRAYRREQAAKASGRNGPPNAQDRFSTTSETDINGGSRRQVSGANVNS
jgi:hypothetical protein